MPNSDIRMTNVGGDAVAEKEVQLVVFELKNGETSTEYGVTITNVQEIKRLISPTKLPEAPAFVEGVINLRGKVIPLIDLRKRFGVNAAENTDDTRIIVVSIKGQTVGIIVDSVKEVLRLPESSIEPPPPVIAGITATYFTGVGKLENRLLVLLDLDSILNEEESQELLEAVG